jgi:hypothetical protein
MSAETATVVLAAIASGQAVALAYISARWAATKAKADVLESKLEDNGR